MLLTRRSVLSCGAAMLVVAPAPVFAQSGTRVLGLYRGEDPIGEERLAVGRQGAEVVVEVRVRINVRLLGLPVYNYTLDARERWRGGSLLSLEARTDDDGTAHFVRAARGGDGVLSVEGSRFTGPVAGEPATTSYWTRAFLGRGVWISTQDGRPLRVTARNAGTVGFPTAAGTVQATRWRIGGDLDGLVLYYDGAGEWIGSDFPARGEMLRFAVTRMGGLLAPLWTGG